MIYLDLFISFLKVGLFSIGGGYAAMPLICDQTVSHHSWLSMSEFTDLITIAEMTPGPIAINSATFVGIRVAGPAGAVIATLGCITPSLFLVSLLAFVYYRYKKLSMLQSVLASLRPAVVALIASAGLSILTQVLFGEHAYSMDHLNLTGLLLFLGAMFLLRKMKWNPILVMSLCGAGGLILGLLPF